MQFKIVVRSTVIFTVKEVGTEKNKSVKAITDNSKHAMFFNIWKIDNFRQRLDAKIPINSPTFSYQFGIQKFKCHMKLCSMEKPDQFSIESHVEPCLKNTTLEVQIFLRNKTGMKFRMNSVFDRMDGLRFKHVIQRDFVEDVLTELIVNDVLTVIVKINIYNCSRSVASNYHRTRDVSGLVDDLTSLFKNGTNSDVKIVIGDRTIDAYKGILSCRSSVFADMFSKDLSEKVVIEKFSYDIINELLRYCYTGIVNRIGDNLLRASDEFNVPELKIHCEKALLERLRVGNAAAMLIQAEQCHADTLKKKTIEFIGENLKAVAKTSDFKRLSKTMFLEIMNIWSDK